MGQSSSHASSSRSFRSPSHSLTSNDSRPVSNNIGDSVIQRSSRGDRGHASNSASLAPFSTDSASNSINPAPFSSDSVSLVPIEAGGPANHASSASVSARLPALADSASSQLKENLEALHNQLMQHAGADYDIATTTTLSYTQFLSYIIKLNEICRLYQDDDGRVLVFAVKKGSDSSIFWKATVRIACVKYHTGTRLTESHRLLNIRQFLQVFRRISYECTAGSMGEPPSPSRVVPGAASGPVAPTTAASAVLGEIDGQATGQDDGTKTIKLEECVICLERQPEVILPCAHAYCMPCIQQWWEYRTGPPTNMYCTIQSILPGNSMERTCPVCRETVQKDDDTWVISEAPDDAQVTHEISKALMGLADSSSGDASRAGGECSGGGGGGACGGQLTRKLH